MDILIFTRVFGFAGSLVFPALHECLLYRVGRPNCHPLARSSTVYVQLTAQLESSHQRVLILRVAR
eukprot:1313123-Pyramimonas_sp.AAC.1